MSTRINSTPVDDIIQQPPGSEMQSRSTAAPERPLGMRPLITVVTVVRNAVDTIEATILSVAAQTLSEVEYVVIDGVSTDGTLDILARQAVHITVCISEPDKGIYDAMNKGLALAQGRWVLFLGGDDVLTSPDILAQVAARLVDDNTIYYGDVVLKSSGQRYCGQIGTYRLMQQNICHQAILYPVTVFKRKLYDLHAGLLADYKYNIELWGSAHRFEYMQVTIAYFEDAGASSRPDLKFEGMRLTLIQQHLGLGWSIVKRMRSLLVAIRDRVIA